MVLHDHWVVVLVVVIVDVVHVVVVGRVVVYHVVDVEGSGQDDSQLSAFCSFAGEMKTALKHLTIQEKSNLLLNRSPTRPARRVQVSP